MCFEQDSNLQNARFELTMFTNYIIKAIFWRVPLLGIEPRSLPIKSRVLYRFSYKGWYFLRDLNPYLIFRRDLFYPIELKKCTQGWIWTINLYCIRILLHHWATWVYQGVDSNHRQRMYKIRLLPLNYPDVLEVGLEPTAIRVSDGCSTNWAIQAYCEHGRNWTYNLLCVIQLLCLIELHAHIVLLGRLELP